VSPRDRGDPRRPGSADAAHQPLLEERLSELGRETAYPPTPDLASSVRRRIEDERLVPGRGGLLGGLFGRLRSLAPASLALVALLVLAGTAVAAGLIIGGLRIIFVEQLPSVPPTVSARPGDAPGANLGLGTASTIADAERATGFEVLVPRSPRLGEPDAVYFSPTVAEGMVSLVYGDRTGMPTSADGVAVLVTEFRADFDDQLVKKVAQSGSTVERVSVSGSPGFWISGGPHVFLYLEPDGDIWEERMRLVGDTLIWERDGLLLRLESGLSREQAIELAESIP
jgi:hypothetical protein